MAGLVADDSADTDSELVDLISGLEDLVAAAAALQARAAVELDRERRAQEAERGVPAARRGRGVAAEIGLAARTSLSRGSRLLGFGKALCLEMPHTMAALANGRLSPWRATLLVKESACLPREDRERFDEELCADPHVLAGLGDRQIGDVARAWCARENAEAVVARNARAEAERRVSLRPAPETMTYLTALLPVAQGVAAYAALVQRADAARTREQEGDAEDTRTRGQVMADALVAAVTGQPEGQHPPVLVNLVMTDTALFTSADTEAAMLPGFGPVPAATARNMVEKAAGAGAWVRRLYMAPRTGALVAMDSRRRRVPQGLGDLVRIRDGGRCRVPWCDAPVRHVDHVVPVAEGGATEANNLQSYCEAHNYAKQALGWRAEPQRHSVETRTPSGHRYVDRAPPLPGSPPGHLELLEQERVPVDYSPGERIVDELLRYAA
ncbi:HNH endonuclease [Pseudactinotalea suaedae]|uniref:HNH endonuclease n=1 Tax=Pseudactinotalea suaedae TaxID=1524924 RepID=UPI0012E128D8|nr:HNH endonuclease signature motif containing protein [Pseudactinotalea suaedae]